MLIATLGWFIQTAAHAATVTAGVQPNPARPNQQIAYTIVVEGGNADGVPNLRLPLQIGMTSAASQSHQVQIVNGRQTIRTIFTWGLMAAEPGEFVIAPQDVMVSGEALKTNEVKLTVGEGAAPEQSGLDPLLQISLDKTEFYQGEVVPIKAVLYINRGTNLRRLGLVEVAKSDFAIQRFPQQSEQALELIGGQPYYVLTFRSTLSALKTGKLQVGPAKMEVLVDIPTEPQPGFPPGFFAMGGEPRKFVVNSPSVPVTVLPLPTEDKPASFSGAVGEFTLNATASPTSLSTGDPITVEITVTGVGNFDALTSPVLTEPTGWKTYPTRRYFTAGQPDPNVPQHMERQVGFTQVLVPEQPLPAVPPFELSFFSPSQKKYVTLRTQPVPISVQAAATASAAPSSGATAVGEGGAAPPPARTPEPEITDILEHLPASPQWITASTPLHRRPLFWAAQAVPLLICLGLLAFAWQRRRAGRLAASPEYKLREIWRQLHEEGLSEAEFYRRAARFIHAVNGSAPSEAAREVLEKYQTLNFSADPQGKAPISPRQRAEALTALAPLLAAKNDAHARSSPIGSAPATALIAFGLLCLGSPQSATADERGDRYQEVIGALQKKDYKRASALTEAALGRGFLSPELFEIMGHVRYREGDFGRATLWYERAALFTPRVPEIRQNLRHLDEKTGFLAFADTSPLNAFGLLLRRHTWTLIATLGGWLLLLGIGGIAIARSQRLRSLCAAGMISGSLLLAVGTAGAVLRPSGEQRVGNLFIVTATGAKAHTAASTTSGTVIDLPPGSQLRLLEKRGAWSYVEIPSLAEPLRGWIEASILTALWPWPVELVP